MKVRRQTSWTVILLLLTLVGITLAQSRSDSTNGGPATQGVGLIRNDPGSVSRVHASVSAAIDIDVSYRHGGTRRQHLGHRRHALEHRLPARKRQSAAPGTHCECSVWRPHRRRQVARFRSLRGATSWFGISPAAHATRPTPRLYRLPNGNVLMLREGKEDRRRSHCGGTHPSSVAGNGQCTRQPDRDQAKWQDWRRCRLGVASVGSPDSGRRQRESELRRCGRASRARRYQFQRRCRAARECRLDAFQCRLLQCGSRSGSSEPAQLQRNLDPRSQHHDTQKPEPHRRQAPVKAGTSCTAGETPRSIAPEPRRISGSTASTTRTGFRWP